MNPLAARIAAIAVAVTCVQYVIAQPVSYTGGTLTENFDSMGSAGTTTPAGWLVGWHDGYPPGTGGSVVRTNNVTPNGGGVAPSGTIAGFNCGSGEGSSRLDRSLGTGPTATASPSGTNRFIEVQIQNNSGKTLKAIDVTYVGKQWRTSSSATGQSFTNFLQYGTDSVNFVFLGLAFDFHTPVTGPANIQLNGNFPANWQTNLGGIFALPAPLPPGAFIYLRWLDVNDPSTDPVLAIDNFSFRGLTNVPPLVIANDFGYTFSLFAGQPGVPGSANGTGTAARFMNPHAIAADGEGNLYVADTGNHAVRKITPLAEVSTFAGLAGVAGTNNGAADDARFNSPEGICVDHDGNVFVTEIGSHTIRRITPGGIVSLVAGLPGVSGTNDGNGSAARFNVPVTVQVNENGFLFVGDFANHTVRVITPAGDVTTDVGLAGVSGTQNGPLAQARLRNPHTCLLNPQGDLLIADLGNHAVRKVSDGVVSTLAGLNGYSGTNDGTGTFARFLSPWGLVFESSGNLLVSDRENNTIRRVAPDGTVKTIGGVAGVRDSTDGYGTQARFSRPRGLALDPRGNLFVVDTANQTIRIGRPDPVLQATLANGQMVLSWPSWTTNYQLESSASLPATNWTPISRPPAVLGDRNFLTNSPVEPALFFRLRSP
jgi:sugar lactone lactonase YvrE